MLETFFSKFEAKMRRPAFQPLFLWSKADDDITDIIEDEKEAYGGEAASPLMPPEYTPREPKRRRLLPYVIHFILLSIALFVAFSGHVKEYLLTEQICIKKLNPYSPLIEKNVVKYEWQYWDGDGVLENEFRGPPKVERELAWLDLWSPAVRSDGGIPVPLWRLAELNKTTEGGLQKTVSGEAAAFVEVFHNIHCISTLRQWFYKDEYMDALGAMPAVFDKTPEEQREHIEHCIERLRLTLMCSADLSVTFVYDDPDAPLGVTPDFNSLHKCRNFNEIKDWVQQHNHDGLPELA